MRMRRFAGIIACFALLAAGQAQAEPSSAGRLEFEVLRNGAPFGVHIVEVTGAAGRFEAVSNVDLQVKLGPITAFRLEQTCTESWRAGALAALRCSTLKDGRRIEITGTREEGALNVRIGRSSEDVERFALDAAPTSWWSRPPLDIDSMINTETGKPMAVRITRLGRERMMVGGASIDVERLRVVGTLTMDLWYDAQGRWVGCAFTARGQRVEYRLASPLSVAPA
jgi:hypothetical protein